MRETLKRRLADPADGPLIRRDIEYEIDREGGPDGLLIMDYPDKSLVGKTLGQVARARHEDPVDTALFFQMNGFDRVGGVEFRAFAVSLLDLEEFMRQDYTGVCTDRGGASAEPPRTARFIHPGTFGTAPRRIRTFVFEKRVTTLPFAVRSLTSSFRTEGSWASPRCSSRSIGAEGASSSFPPRSSRDFSASRR